MTPVLVGLLGLVVVGCAVRILLLGRRDAVTDKERAAKRRATNRTAGAMVLAVLGLVVVEFVG